MASLLDVVIPVFGRADLLKKCLECLETQTFKDFSIVLVDDASPDFNELRPIYQKAVLDGIKVVKNNQNRGFPYSVNEGVMKGKAPLVLLLNSDVLLEPEALEQMVRVMDTPEVGVVGALLTFPEDSEWNRPNERPLGGMVQHAGMAFNIGGKPFHVHLGWSPNNKRIVYNDELQIVTGACLMTRRNLWMKIGGMAKEYGRGTYEDMEYCLKVKALGMRVAFSPAARGVHRTGASAAHYEGAGFPLNDNYSIFRKRNGVVWDEHRVW